MPILIDKHCRLNPSPDDGTRLLVMRYWPRGMSKDRFESWLPHMAPSPGLLKWLMDRSEGQKWAPDDVWEHWSMLYRREMKLQKDAILDLRRRQEEGETITLLCSCHDKSRCHRSILHNLILEGEYE